MARAGLDVFTINQVRFGFTPTLPNPPNRSQEATYRFGMDPTALVRTPPGGLQQNRVNPNPPYLMFKYIYLFIFITESVLALWARIIHMGSWGAE